MSRSRVIPMSDHSAEITSEDIKPTILPDDFLDTALAREVRAFHMPRFNQIPDVELYREQVISFVDSVLAPLAPCVEGPWLTPSMVNNYVKARLIAAPQKKLYGREQIARLVVICIFKQVLSISAISELFAIQKMTYITDVAYDYVATELEHALAQFFTTEAKASRDSASRVTRESLLVRSAVLAFAAKAHLVGYLSFLGYQETAQR